MGTTLSQQFFGCGPGALLLKSSRSCGHLRDLVVYEGFLGLQEASVLTRESFRSTDDLVSHMSAIKVALAFRRAG